LCPIGKARAWVESGKVDKLPSWETKKERDDRIKLFTKGGFTGPLNWYKVQIRNIDAPAFEAIPPENIVLNIPVLFVGGDQDYATRSEIMYQVADLGKQQGWLPTVEVKIIAGASHWLLLEKPKEIFTILDKVAKNLK
jgi:pimeloyl-ACP methyl ester carboxylesterase